MTYKMLDVLDELIEGYALKHSAYPLSIIANSQAKDKILSEFYAYLDSCTGTDKNKYPNCYRGIPIIVDEAEPFVRVK